jgi:hypothetical protein
MATVVKTNPLNAMLASVPISAMGQSPCNPLQLSPNQIASNAKTPGTELMDGREWPPLRYGSPGHDGEIV